MTKEELQKQVNRLLKEIVELNELNDKQEDKIKARGERIRYVRKNFTSLTQEEFATELDVHHNTFASWEGGRYSGLSAKGAKLICKYMAKKKVSCAEEWLLDGFGIPPTKEASQSEKNKAIYEEISTFCKIYKNGVGFKITDSAMEPFYQKEDYVAGLITAPLDCIDKDCIVTFNDSSQLLRRVSKALKNDSGETIVELDCLNYRFHESTKHLVDIAVKSLAPIIRVYPVNFNSYPLLQP